MSSPGPALPQNLRVALVHHWLVSRRGGEEVLEALGRLTPGADLYTHVYRPEVIFGSLAAMRLRTTSIARLPAARSLYPAYLPFMPAALEALDMNPYDLIVSSEAGPAKWVIPRPDAAHICYSHSPMRYVWDQRQSYLSKIPAWLRPTANLVAGGLRNSDLISSFRVTAFVANSRFISQRIKQYYRRESEVVHPPVDIDQYMTAVPEDFYLCAGQVVSYKRIDLAVQACTRLGRRLVVAGGGDVRRLREIAGPHVTFLGHVDRATLNDLMSKCRALLFPGVEDFGIIPVETMASGRPVIAYAKGGALDTVDPGKSGLLFDRQDVDALCDAILRFEREPELSQLDCVTSAKRFDRSVFERKMSAVMVRALAEARR